MNNTTTPHTRFKHARLFLSVSMFVLGICGIAYEYLLGLIGNYLMGSSHEQIFIVIGIMMFAMGIGAVIQKQLHSHLIFWFILLEVILGFLGGFAPFIIYASFSYLLSYHLILYSVAFAIGSLIGLEIPLLLRINAQYVDTLKTNLSDILSMDYVGSLAGALIFTYVLLKFLSIPYIGFALGLTNTCFAIMAYIYFFPLIQKKRVLIFSFLISIGAHVIGISYADPWMHIIQQRCFEDPIIHTSTSQYQHFVITQYEQRLRLYLNGHLQFDSRDEYIYHELLTHVPMLTHTNPQDILILGGGDGLALREVLKYSNTMRVDLVDIDPAIISLAKDNPLLQKLNNSAFKDVRVHTSLASVQSQNNTHTIYRASKATPNLKNSNAYPLGTVQVFTVDADMFLQNITKRYDVVIIDFPDPRTIELGKLYSVEFYKNLMSHVKPGAVVSIQSTSPYRAMQAYACIARSLLEAGFHSLPYYDYLPSFGDWGWHLAWSDNSINMQERIRQITTIPVGTKYITPQIIKKAFIFGKDKLLSPDMVKPNSKFNPILLTYYNKGFQ